MVIEILWRAAQFRRRFGGNVHALAPRAQHVTGLIFNDHTLQMPPKAKRPRKDEEAEDDDDDYVEEARNTLLRLSFFIHIA